MGHANTAEDELFEDREIRDSIMIIRRQRNTKLLVAIFGIVGALVIAFIAVYLAYGDELEATKDLPAQAP